MKKTLRLTWYICFGLAALFAGCSKDNNPVNNSQLTPSQAVESALSKADSVLAFESSDSATIDDQVPLDWEVAGLAKTLIPIHPFRWGRRIEGVSRQVSVDFLSDSTAIATVTKTFRGHLLIDTSSVTGSGAVIVKPFNLAVTRRILFARVRNISLPDSGWMPVALSLSTGNTVPESLNQFTIKSVEIDYGTTSDTVTDPLNTWLYLFHPLRAVPVFVARDTITVKVTVDSKDDSTEITVLRHSVGPLDLVHSRTRMILVSTTSLGGGVTERVYRQGFRTRGLSVITGRAAIGRFNATVDVLSHGSLFDDSASVSNRYWGLPYFVKP